jgi:hypothetical protein
MVTFPIVSVAAFVLTVPILGWLIESLDTEAPHHLPLRPFFVKHHLVSCLCTLKTLRTFKDRAGMVLTAPHEDFPESDILEAV